MWFHKLALVEHEGIQETSMKLFHTAVHGSHFIKPGTERVRYVTSQLSVRVGGRWLLQLTFVTFKCCLPYKQLELLLQIPGQEAGNNKP